MLLIDFTDYLGLVKGIRVPFRDSCITMFLDTCPNYKAFVSHLIEYEKAGAPISTGELITLAKRYNCEVPTRVNGKFVFK
jgi:hypothetical protein